MGIEIRQSIIPRGPEKINGKSRHLRGWPQAGWRTRDVRGSRTLGTSSPPGYHFDRLDNPRDSEGVSWGRGMEGSR